MLKQLSNRLTELRKIIDRADQAYHSRVGQVFLSDEQYDALKRELLQLCPSDERINRVGAPVGNTLLTKFRHTHEMGSLSKCKNFGDEFKNWFDLVVNTSENKSADIAGRSGELLVALKADGATLALYYENGKLARAVTRGGDNGIGEDVTANAIHFTGVLTELPVRTNMIVRGECILTTKNWKEIDPDSESNPRNLGNGVMGRLDSRNAEMLTFIAFNCIPTSGKTLPDEVVTDSDKLKMLRRFGFKVIPHIVLKNKNDPSLTPKQNRENILKRAEIVHSKINYHRPSLPFWIDGVVYSFNNLQTQASAGYSSNCPVARTVVKFEPEGAETTLIDVVISVGHTGSIIPTGKLEPVMIGGTTISSVLLNNWDEIEALDLKIGSRIRVIKAQDIIPKVQSVIYTDQQLETRPIPRPTVCPVCNSELVSSQDVVAIKCVNGACPAIVSAKVDLWITKNKIDGIGPEVLYALINNCGVTKPSDLYRLTVDRISSLKLGKTTLGAKRAKSIIDSIESTKSMPLSQFIGSLGVPLLGRRRAEIMMNNSNGQLKTVDDWLSGKIITMTDTLGVPNAVTVMAEGLAAMSTEINQLLLYVTIADDKPAIQPTSSKLTGCRFVFTGKIMAQDKFGNRLTREDLHKLVIDNGGKTADSVTSAVTHLVQADPNSTSSKSKQAVKLGVQILSESKFLEMIGWTG